MTNFACLTGVSPRGTFQSMAPIIEVNNLVKTYPGVRAVDHIDLAIEQGICFGLLGPNGAGIRTGGPDVADAGLVPRHTRAARDDAHLAVRALAIRQHA